MGKKDATIFDWHFGCRDDFIPNWYNGYIDASIPD
jgi:hypothetical protein